MKRVLLIALSVILAVTLAVPMGAALEGTPAGDVITSQVTANAATDTKEWTRILSDYAEYVQVGSHYYYYKYDMDTGIYRVYRQNVKTGAWRQLLKFKAEFMEFYTNGTQLVYAYRSAGTVIKVKNISTGATKTIVDLTKYKTSSSIDTVHFIHLYGNRLYYSKLRGLKTDIYNIYRVNIDTGAWKVLKSGYIMGYPEEDSVCSGRYFVVMNKSKVPYVLDTQTLTLKKLTDSTMCAFTRIGNYWYWVNTTKKSGQTRQYRVCRKIWDVSKSGIILGKWARNFSPDSIVEISDKGVFFLEETDYSKEFVYKTGKVIKRSDRDVWYYINYQQRFL